MVGILTLIEQRQLHKLAVNMCNQLTQFTGKMGPPLYKNGALSDIKLLTHYWCDIGC